MSLIEETLNHDGSEYSVHPVIHVRISDRLSPEDKRSYLSDSVPNMLSKFTIGLEEREDLASYRYLQSHALLQINFPTEIDLKSEELALLNLRYTIFMRRSDMTFDSVRLATQAVAIGEEIWGTHSEPTSDACVEKVVCLIADSRYREGYNESKSVMGRLDSTKLENETLGHDTYLVLRAEILEQKGEACWGLGEYKEVGDIANELISLRTHLPEDFENILYYRFAFINSLMDQRRFQEAQEMNNELLNSMNEQQRTAHRMIFLLAYSAKAAILSGIRKGSDAEPAMILSDDEEGSILRIYQYVFDEYRTTLPITEGDLWIGCNNLLGELEKKGKMPEAAGILMNMLTEAVESRLRLQGRTVEDFSTMLGLGLSVIDSLYGYGDARQKPPGLPIANLFVQMIAVAGSGMIPLRCSGFLSF